MKKITFLVLFMFVSVIVFSQTQEETLKAQEWYVYKVDLNSNEYYPLDNQENGNTVNLSYGQFQNEFLIQFCNEFTLTEGLQFIEDNAFTYANTVSFGTGCVIPENYTFYNYYWQFWGWWDGGADYYQYVINEIDSSVKELVLTRENGNKAYFYSSYLSNNIHHFEEAKIYPNPTQSFVNVSLPVSDYEQIIFNIYDVSGRKVKSITEDYQNNIRLDISSLTSGNYFIELNTLNNRGRGYVRKIIKE